MISTHARHRRSSALFTALAPLLGAACLLAGAASTARATTYNGNGATGFGGGVGGSTLTVTSAGSNINFSLSSPGGFSGNALVFYIDSKTGGVNNTSTFTDTADNGRTSISGLNGSGRTLANFPTGFGADFAVTVLPGNNAYLYNLGTPSNFSFVNNGGLDPSATTLLNFSFARTDLSLPATGGFTFVASLISTSAYRANETIGTSVTVPGMPGDAPNAGFTGSQTFSASNTFGTPAPEPSTWALLATGAGLAGLATLRRRARPA